ncbi:MAG: ABC transporter substrate-binding protein [Armatimonadota bacterium]|nr:ABC transporter substrate-binding protein [Armatimonadota bacterium]MDR7444840.1 ABC transporter substrate-binding protein [Armatimonadota bacterium]MDR7570006.1 ABC transporter substrate-binding protein [Armatimonadota bacterium]MDR7615170.1 ABC transporter substrate-binding protein [Armatimonadota bacterium]
MRRSELLVLIGLLVGLVSVSPGIAQQGPVQLDLPVVAAVEPALPVLVAEAAGYFRGEGVEVGRILLSGGVAIRNLLIGGRTSFGVIGTEHIPLARLAGAPLKGIAPVYDRLHVTLIVRSALRRQVRRVEDLKGRTVGVTAPGSFTWSIAVTFLKKAGLEPERDVRLLPVGTDASVMYTALQTGRVDALAFSEPVLSRVEVDGVGFMLVNIFDPYVLRRWMGTDLLLVGVLATTESVIRSQPEVVAAMVRAVQKGLAYIRSHSSQEIVQLVVRDPKTAQLFQGVAPELAVKMINRIRHGYGTGCLSRTGYEAELRRMMDTGVIKQPVPFEEALEPRWAGVCAR